MSTAEGYKKKLEDATRTVQELRALLAEKVGCVLRKFREQ